VEQYQAGVCNIGGAEVARRRQVAYLGAVLFLAAAAFSIINNYSAVASLIVIIPALIFSIGLVQSRKRFCLAYGLMGTFNFAKLGSITKVEDKAALAADRKTALAILVQSLGLSLALTSAIVLINSL
jgi:hypothetical protein